MIISSPGFQIVKKKISPPYLFDTFTFAVGVTSSSGSNLNRLFDPRVRTNYGKQ